MSLFEPKIEKMARTDLENLQDKKLRNVIARAYSTVGMYREKLKTSYPKKMGGLRDLEKIPFTTKDDLRTYSLLERLAVPEIELVRYLSSGTTEKSVVFGMTLHDLDIHSTCCAKSFSCATISREDKVLQIFPSGLFPIWVAQTGLQKIGAKIIHTLPGRTRELQLAILLGKLEKVMKPTAVTALASYLLRIAEVAKEEDIDPQEFNVRKLIYSSAAEIVSEAKRRLLAEEFGGDVFDAIGFSEIAGGPAIAAECQVMNGLHIWENYFIVEVVDPKTGERLGPEESGELVITSLENVAHPIIRYRTGNITKMLEQEKCECGRTSIKIRSIEGRTDTVMNVKGILLHPRDVEEVLLSIPAIGSEYRVIIREIGGLDDLLIIAEMRRDPRREADPFDRSIAADLLTKELISTFKNTFNITPRVEIIPSGTMKRGKAKRFVDLRNPLH